MEKDIFALIKQEEDVPLPLLTYTFTNTPDLNIVQHDNTPFLLAVRIDKYYIVEHMLRYNATLKKKLGSLVPPTSLFDTSYVDEYGDDAMKFACYLDDDDMLKLLLEYKVPLGDVVHSPVCYCARMDMLSKLKLFNKYGIPLDKLYPYKIAKLLDHPPEVYEPYHLFTPLTIAYLFGKFEAVEYLLSNGANPLCNLGKTDDGIKYSLFRYVNLRNNHDETVMFIDNMKTFNVRDHALLDACNRKNASIEVVKKLVSIGGYNVNGVCVVKSKNDVNARYSPLYYACLHGNAEIVRYLLECGATDNLEEVIKRVKYENSSNVDVLVGYINSAFSWFKS